VEIDKLLGTDYLKRFGKNGKLSAASLIPIVSQIARNCNLGLLVVDEIQNLSLAKSGGAEQMLSFFVTLSNSIGLPTVLIGTPKAMSLFSEFRIARRGSGQGDMVWEPMRKDEQSWKLFLEGMWDYQWLRKPTPLTEELNDAIYEASCGITDIVVKVFIMSQIKAITSAGIEELTPQLIRNVAKENLILVQPMLKALRSGNPVQIAKYSDIQPVQIDGFVAMEQSKLELGSMLKTFQKAHQDQKNGIERLKQDAIVRLMLLGISEQEAKLLIQKVVHQNPQLQKVNEIIQEAYKLHLGFAVGRNSEKVEEDLDLRTIVRKGKEAGKSAYQALKEAGIIVSDFKVQVT
jgi:hypothetical protein